MSSPAVLFEHARRSPSPRPRAAHRPGRARRRARRRLRPLADRVRYRPLSRWTQLLEPADAAALLHPDLHRDLAGVQIWVLSWLPGQGTPLHDHGRSAGAFAVVRGVLTERVVATGPARRARVDRPARRRPAAAVRRSTTCTR